MIWELQEAAVVLVFGALVLSGVGLVAMMLRGRQRLQELAVRERIALIERGLLPSPEKDPGQFDRLLTARRTVHGAAARYQTAGVIFMGLGAALAVLLTFAARVPGVGLGVGGALAILGLAAFINGSLLTSGPPPPPPPRESADS